MAKIKIATWKCRRCGNTYKVQMEKNENLRKPGFCECKHRDFELVPEQCNYFEEPKKQKGKIGLSVGSLISGKGEYHMYNLNQGVFKDHFYFGKLMEFEDQLTETVVFDDGSAAINFEKIKIDEIVAGKRKRIKVPYGKNQIKEIGFGHFLPLMYQDNFWSNKNIKSFINRFGIQKGDGVVSVGSVGRIRVEDKSALDSSTGVNNNNNNNNNLSSSLHYTHPLHTLTTLNTLNPNGSDLLRFIIQTQDYYMDVPNRHVFLLGGAYVLATYCYTLFNSIGYLFFNSDKESGKTKHAELLGLMGFHTINSSNPSESALFRVISMGKGLMVIDDFEKMSDEKKNALNQILKIGYRKGGKTLRVEKQQNSFMPAWFDCYCPKIITNTTTLDAVTLSRCIPIHLIKTLTIKGQRSPNEKEAFWQDLRNACHVWVMQNWRKIKEEYDNYQCDSLNNRDLELVKGLLAVVKSIDRVLHQQLLDYLLQCFIDREQVDLTGDTEYILFDVLQNKTGEGEWVQTKDIVIWLKDHILNESGCETSAEYREKVGRNLPGTRYVGKKLSRIPLFKKRRVGAGVEYFISKKLVEDYMKIKGFYTEKGDVAKDASP